MNTNQMQPDQTIEIDTGYVLITLSAEMFKGKKAFTTYVNNISLRSTSLHIPRVLDNFIECIDCMSAPLDDNAEGITAQNERDIRAFVALHLNPL